MSQKTAKTNAVRILDTHQIPYELREYEVDEEHVDAMHVAESLGVNPEGIYKTLILKGNVEPYIVAVIPANTHLDMKKFAKVSGNKNCEMLPLKDVLNVTGYIRGGCSPIGMKKQFPTYIEELAILQDRICISAGKRGLQILLNAEDLKPLIGAQFADITQFY
ncbi:Cys-tRNA(Pro) deacylase [Empedobacter brevis]|uniref:Cys-tRNA(Pro)/Cys-tRNA(Cys) deacylase n=1 Tax=Empedobacter brevis NBRC 14943 = ATCC 43319 TaxID=1218108 RepID=A0A511NEX8_9FLAO|nr:Cys-tRNA(Pro) deacylase [Empedobacter brevis]QES93837.1 Cys-tRNA(Pro) deacylase [Empedobacter brevis]GEM51362.1 Cys-tRNA(Pro)/Cys-tRNA(Cys) deacylase [Empedobacter brevis NBRC 14943 = ATCC 43319]